MLAPLRPAQTNMNPCCPLQNPANPKIHYETTGPEIWEQTKGQVDILIAGAHTSRCLGGMGAHESLWVWRLRELLDQATCQLVTSVYPALRYRCGHRRHHQRHWPLPQGEEAQRAGGCRC